MEKIQSEDVLIEILVLLPPKSIFRFICVSRRWRNIIINPFFLQRHSAASRRCRRHSDGGSLRALFQSTTLSHHTNTQPRRRSDGAFFQKTTVFDHCNTLRIGGNNIIKDIPKNLGYFINSSNGLILCSREVSPAIYHVLNPITGKYVSLPPPPHRYIPKSTGIICTETTTDLVPIYTIVRAGLPLISNEAKNLYIDAYSSTTSEWSNPRLLAATDNFSLLSQPPVVANGVFHWYLSEWDREGIAVYDPNDSENHLQLIRLPYFAIGDSYAISRSTDDDLLWFGAVSIWFDETGGKRMKFFRLPKGGDGSYRRKTNISSEEWVLMYNIRLNLLYEGVKIWTDKIILDWIFSPWDSKMVAVLRQGKEVFLCNLQSKSIEMVEFYGRHSGCDDNYLCPYIESSFLSSYAL